MPMRSSIFGGGLTGVRSGTILKSVNLVLKNNRRQVRENEGDEQRAKNDPNQGVPVRSRSR